MENSSAPPAAFPAAHSSPVGAAARAALVEGVSAAASGVAENPGRPASLYVSSRFFNMSSPPLPPAADAAVSAGENTSAASGKEEEHSLMPEQQPEQLQQQQPDDREMSASCGSRNLHEEEADEQQEQQQQRLRPELLNGSEWLLQPNSPPLHDVVHAPPWSQEPPAANNDLDGSSRLLENGNSCSVLPLCADPAADFCLYTQTNVPLPASLCHSAAAVGATATLSCPPSAAAHQKADTMDSSYDDTSRGDYETPSSRSGSHYTSAVNSSSNYTPSSSNSNPYDGRSGSYGGNTSSRDHESNSSSDYEGSSSSGTKYAAGSCRNYDSTGSNAKYERSNGSRGYARSGIADTDYEPHHSSGQCDSSRDYDSSSSRCFDSSSSTRDLDSGSSDTTNMGCPVVGTTLSSAAPATAAAEATAEAETDVEAESERSHTEGLSKKASPLVPQSWPAQEVPLQQEPEYLGASPAIKTNTMTGAGQAEKATKDVDCSSTATRVTGSRQGKPAHAAALYDMSKTRNSSSSSSSAHAHQQQSCSPVQQKAASAAEADAEQSGEAATVTAAVNSAPRVPSASASPLRERRAASAAARGAAAGERQRKRNVAGGAAGAASGSKPKASAARGGERRRKTQLQHPAAEKRDAERRGQRSSHKNNDPAATGKGRVLPAECEAATRAAASYCPQQNPLLFFSPVLPIRDNAVGSSSSPSCTVACKEAFFTTAQQLAAAAAAMPIPQTLPEGEAEGTAVAESASPPSLEKQQQSAGCLDSNSYAQQAKHSYMLSPVCWGEGPASPLSSEPHAGTALATVKMKVDKQQQQQRSTLTNSSLSSPPLLCASSFDASGACSTNRNSSGNGSRSSSGGGSGSGALHYASPQTLSRSSSSLAGAQQQQQYPRILRAPSAPALSKAAVATAQPYGTPFSPLHWDCAPFPDSSHVYVASRAATSSAAFSDAASSSRGAPAPLSTQVTTPSTLALLPSFAVSEVLPSSSSSLEETATGATGRRLTAAQGATAAAPAAGTDPPNNGLTAGSSPAGFCGSAAAAKEQPCCSSRAASAAGRYISAGGLEQHAYTLRSSSSNAERLSGAPGVSLATELVQQQQHEQRETRSRGNSASGGGNNSSSNVLGGSCARCSTYRSSSGNSSSPTSPSGYGNSSNSSRYPNASNSCSSTPSYSGSGLNTNLSYSSSSSSHSGVYSNNNSGRFERSGAAGPLLTHDRQQHLVMTEENYASFWEEAEPSTAARNGKPSTFNSSLQEVFAGLPLPPASVAASSATHNGLIGEPAPLPHSPSFSSSSSSLSAPALHALDKLARKSPGDGGITTAASPVRCEALVAAYPVGNAGGAAATEAAAGTNCKNVGNLSLVEIGCGSSACSTPAAGASFKREKSNGMVAAVAAAAAALPPCLFHPSSSSLGTFSFSPPFSSASSSSPGYSSSSSSSSQPSSFPPAFSPTYSSALLPSGRGSAAPLRQPPGAAASSRRLLVTGSAGGGGGGASAPAAGAGAVTAAAAGGGGGEQQQQDLFSGGRGSGSDASYEVLSPSLPGFNGATTAAAAHMSILSNVLYSSYEHPGQIKSYSPFPLSAAAGAASMHTRDPVAASGSPLLRHVAAAGAGAGGGNGVLHITAATYNTLTPRTLSPTTLSTQTSVHEDVVTCIPDNSAPSDGAAAGAAAGARSAAASHALRQQHFGAQQLLFQATLQDALASADAYTQPLPYGSSSRAAGGGGGGGPASHVEEFSASSPPSAAQPQYQHQHFSVAAGTITHLSCAPSLSYQLHGNATAESGAPRLDVFVPAGAVLPSSAAGGGGRQQQQPQQQSSSGRGGGGGGWSGGHDAPVTLAAEGWMAVASCCSGRAEPKVAGGSAVWQDTEQQDFRDCFHYYLAERQHPAVGFCSAAAAGFAAAAAPLHAHYKRGWGREEGMAEHNPDVAATGGGALAKKIKMEGTQYPLRNAALPEDDWQEGHSAAAAEAAAAALVAAAAAGACSAAGGGGNACNPAAGTVVGDGSSRCCTTNSAGTVGAQLRLPRKLFTDGRRWSDDLMEESDLEIDSNIQWHEGFTLPLGKDGRGELIKRMRAVHKADREFYRFTLEEMGIDFKRLAHATVEELWKIAFRWGLFPYAIKLSRKYGRANSNSSRKKTRAAAAKAGGGAGAAGGVGRGAGEAGEATGVGEGADSGADGDGGRCSSTFAACSSSSPPSSFAFSPSCSSSSTSFASASAPTRPAVAAAEAKSSLPAAEEPPQAGVVSTGCDPSDPPSPEAGSLCAEGLRTVAEIDWM